MTEAAVAHFERGLGDIALPRAQKFRRAFHADVAQMLLDRHARLLRKKSAEIKRAAPDQPSEFLKRRRLAHLLRKDDPDALDAFARRPLLPGAEQFAIGRAEEELRRQFERLAFEPQFLLSLEERPRVLTIHLRRQNQ